MVEDGREHAPPLHLKCGLCSKFHTRRCPMDEEGARFGVWSVKAGDDACEEFHLRSDGDLIQVFSDHMMDAFTLKYMVRDGVPLGLFKWDGGMYVECEEELKSYVERLAKEMGLSERVRCYVVREAVEKTKRRTYFELKEEPMRIVFKNFALDWPKLLTFNENSPALGEVEEALSPVEDTKDKPAFHLIPHNLNVPLLKEGLKVLKDGGDVKTFMEEKGADVVELFRQWVGDRWPLLFEVLGYTLYPKYVLHKAFMLVGDGRNGKTTFLTLVENVLGKRNTVQLSLQELCAYRFAPCELYHKLANIFPDIPSKPIEYTGWFKALTGQDVISAPRKFAKSLSFENYAKLLFSANELPEVSDMTEAFWRRWIVVDFPNRFEDNPNFFEKHFTEDVVEKVIALSITAFANVYMKRRFTVEEGSGDFKEKWLKKANSVYAYVKTGLEEGWLVLEKDGRTASEKLYNNYLDFCEGMDMERESKASFTRELERLFRVTKKRVREGGSLTYAYVGVKLKEKVEETGQAPLRT